MTNRTTWKKRIGLGRRGVVSKITHSQEIKLPIVTAVRFVAVSSMVWYK
jgi:hypothetical protein